MSHAYVVLRLPDGREVYVPPGTVIGRLLTSPVAISDPRISEAHCLITHRGASLSMVGLQQRALKVAGDRTRERVELAEGQRISLATGYDVEVIKVALPSHLAVVEARRMGERAWRRLGTLSGSELHSVTADPALVAGRREGALCLIGTSADSWVLFDDAGGAHAIEDLPVWEREGWQLQFLWIPQEQASVPRTQHTFTHYRRCHSMRVEGDLVWVTPLSEGEALPPHAVSGQPAQLLTVMIRAYEENPRPRRWLELGQSMWREWAELDRSAARARWDQAVRRTREKLLQVGLDPDTLYRDPECPGRYGLRFG